MIVVGGFDPSGGAGLLRDAATAAARGARVHAVGTAWTVQGDGVHRVEPRPPAAVRTDVIDAIATLRPTAVKIGMAVGPATAAALVEGLGDYSGPVVVDPVLATSRGGALWEGAPRDLLPLLRRATLATPNAVEAAALTGRTMRDVDDAERAGVQLVEQDGLRSALVKGGHLDEALVTDVLVTPGRVRPKSHARVAGRSPRGTGCALATAIAVDLGRGRDLLAAVDAATAWLVGAIAAAVDVGGERHLG
ncbi:MAG TPA: bifunctional hydroxymethylpyrimidine kinase/phosphomethylpyrimidine kinase [Polyangia bacterium]